MCLIPQQLLISFKHWITWIYSRYSCFVFNIFHCVFILNASSIFCWKLCTRILVSYGNIMVMLNGILDSKVRGANMPFGHTWDYLWHVIGLSSALSCQSICKAVAWLDSENDNSNKHGFDYIYILTPKPVAKCFKRIFTTIGAHLCQVSWIMCKISEWFM